MQAKTLILLGDSITEAFPTEKLSDEYNIINKGVYGDNTSGVLSRLNKDVISHYPDVIYILIGTNDLARERTDEEIIKTLHLIIDKLTSSLILAEIYLTSILPTLDIANRPNARIDELNQKIKLLSDRFGIQYFNLADDFKDDQGKMKKELTEDGLHLSNEGYQLWRSVLRQKLSTKITAA